MLYYCIECLLGNGKEKPYPSDHVSIYGEDLNEVIKKFGKLNRSACFECWQKVYLTPWIYSGGEYDPGEPIQIKFLPHFKIKIDGFGEFQLEKPGGINET